MGMGVDCPGVVGIPTTGIFHLFVYEKFKQRAQKQKVGDPTSWLAGIDCYYISLLNRVRFDAVLIFLIFFKKPLDFL